MKLLLLFFLLLLPVSPLLAQSNKLIKELESKRGALQKQIAESETLLITTKKDVGSQLNGLCCTDRTDRRAQTLYSDYQ